MGKRQSNGTGTFRTRKDGMIEYRVSLGLGVDGKKMRKSFYGKTKNEALQSYKDWLKESGNTPIEKVETVSERADKWLELYKKDKVAYGTYNNYKMYVDNHIKPALGKLKLEQVRPAHIQQFFQNRSNLSPSAERHINITLKGIFDSAVENHFCKESPIKPMKSSKMSADKIKVFTLSQITKMLKDAPTHKYGAYIQLLLYTGLRMGELLALQWVDVQDTVIVVRQSLARAEGGSYENKVPKSGKSRNIGITDKLQAVLDTIPRQGIYVLSDPDGSQITLSAFDKRYRKFFSETNNFCLSPHKCRHTYATYLAKGGAEMSSIQALLGHSSMHVTEIYIDVDTDDIQNNVQKLGY